FRGEVAASPPFLEDGILVSQPSPLGEGAPKGQIGHKRYEKERQRASQVNDLRKHPIHRFAVPLPHAGKAHRWRLRRSIKLAMPESSI
ncbi:MAG TPA: hypothetical protein DCG08_05565, partial [Dialister sp.]|nr:hypothetical protein [Dialister sp.]